MGLVMPLLTTSGTFCIFSESLQLMHPLTKENCERQFQEIAVFLRDFNRTWLFQMPSKRILRITIRQMLCQNDFCFIDKLFGKMSSLAKSTLMDLAADI